MLISKDVVNSNKNEKTLKRCMIFRARPFFGYSLVSEEGSCPKYVSYIFLKSFHFWYYSVFTDEHLAIYKPNQV